ncbi:hypothetical protein [Kocuria sp.]|uniref:hypothetical protein n=1 Tax=Kocuria sp. TaxID=1871328 RepID=UPI0026DFBD2D|nr:hypothetical protein [Kocuria sp.]MDO5618151.1 hypothetical protein [Kocuria sp.]
MNNRRRLRDHGIAFGWGVAEATVFFVVPDAWTSYLALHKPRRGFITTATATAGALLGGAVVHRWASMVPAAHSAEWAARIPAINTAMVSKVDRQMAEHGLKSLMIGPFTGTPYKLYARSAGVQGFALVPFVAWSIPARMTRFVLVTGVVGALAGTARRIGVSGPGRGLARIPGVTAEGAERVVFVASWAAFYAWFFRSVGR